MTDRQSQRPMPPGLKTQIVFAALLTVAALLLPSALSADPSEVSEVPMRGTVTTTMTVFSASQFSASQFGDWDSAN